VEKRALPAPIRDFKDLEVWKAARDLRHEFYKLVKALPDLRSMVWQVKSGVRRHR